MRISYKHFGRQIIESLLNRSLPQDDLEYVYRNVYDHFVEEIDGNDNGVNSYSGDSNYKVTTTISSRVARLGISWREEWTEEKEQERFRFAMGLMIGEFAQRVHIEADEILPARSIVREAMEDAKKVHPSGEILVMKQNCPYMEHVFALEKERGEEGKTKFVVVENSDGSWRVRAMNAGPGTFEVRKKILANCLGLRDEELSRASGIEGCIFVHINGFIGSNKTKEGALKMAIQSLD